MGSLGASTDGVVSIRPPRPDDGARLVAGRDAEFHRFLGEGTPDPRPTSCIEVDHELVGWVDFDLDREWLDDGEINLGYNVFAPHRGCGYASRAVRLLLHRLAIETEHKTATLVIDTANVRSLALAARTGFDRRPDLDGHPYFAKPIPPLSYTDGAVTLRPPRMDDLDMDVSAKDEEQIRRMWLPGERESWEEMSSEQQHEHARAGLAARVESFGRGPKWTFSVDTPTTEYVAYVDCDLANDQVPAGEANISYSAHPDHRGNGYVSRGVALALRFLRDHTGARWAHIIADADNIASRQVAESVGAEPVQSWSDDAGRTMLRHTIALDRHS